LYDRSDGLPTRECSGGAQPSIHRTRDGRLLFAMTDGAVALSPCRVEVNPLPPPVLVEGVRVDGKEQVDGGGNIGPGRHVVEFHYTATSLVAPAKVRFRCRLDGVDKEWRDAGASRSAMYSLTAPGAYRFRVAACNNDGIWNEAGAEASVMVVPYVWQRLWFRFGAIGAVLGIIGGSIRFVERRKLQRRLAQLEMQQMVERERARIARDIHDDLGASLTEMSLLGEFAQRESGEQVKADVRKMAEKARSSTKALDEIVWAVNPRHDTLEGFVNYACSYAQEQLSLAGIRCRIEAPSPVPRRVLRADKRHHLFLAFKEAITNIVKHARASEAQMRITTDDDSVRVMITDNGSGFDCSPGSSRASLGNGLTNMKERLQSVGGTFACESTPGNGTHIKLTMKLTCE
jgi:signal transduction histidine kinase